ncbi:MAG: hypothetical protein ACR2NA_13210 [Solirubrobacterales bacterium]
MSAEQGQEIEIVDAELPVPRDAGELDQARGDVIGTALAAAGGLAAGAATIAAMHVARRATARSPAWRVRRVRRGAKVAGSRSFLIDVHMLDR